ncbi:MAG: nucleotidyltransferase domain-containing protein [Oscillospiraceae bacterium]|nr:nucleotidyltransferase domain-containing protein [Oscillospiraceae bacterium]
MEKIYSIDEIKRILNPVFKSYPVYKATLFGSYARGEANSLSDLDIVADSRGEIAGVEFFAMWADAEDSLSKRIDMIELVELRKESPIYENIQKEGVIIYDCNR